MDGPVAVESPRSATNVRDLGILPETVHLIHTIGLDPMACPSNYEIPLRTSLRTVGQPKRRLPAPTFKLGEGCPERTEGNPAVRHWSTDSHGRQPSSEVRPAKPDVRESTPVREKTSVPTIADFTERVHSQSRSKNQTDTSMWRTWTL